MISSTPAATAASTTHCTDGLPATGTSSFGTTFVAGSIRVPSPATGMTALRIFKASGLRADVELLEERLEGLVDLLGDLRLLDVLRRGDLGHEQVLRLLEHAALAIRELLLMRENAQALQHGDDVAQVARAHL